MNSLGHDFYFILEPFKGFKSFGMFWILVGQFFAKLYFTTLMFVLFLFQLPSFQHQVYSASPFYFSSCFSFLYLASLFKFLSLQRYPSLPFPWSASLKILFSAAMSQRRSQTKRNTMKWVILFSRRHLVRQFASSALTWLITPTRSCALSLAKSSILSTLSVTLATRTAKILWRPCNSWRCPTATEWWGCSSELLEIPSCHFDFNRWEGGRWKGRQQSHFLDAIDRRHCHRCIEMLKKK